MKMLMASLSSPTTERRCKEALREREREGEGERRGVDERSGGAGGGG